MVNLFILTEVWRRRSSPHGYKMAWESQKRRLAWGFYSEQGGVKVKVFAHLVISISHGEEHPVSISLAQREGEGKEVVRLTSCQQLSNIKRWSASHHCSQMITSIPLKWLGKHIQMIVLVVIYIRISSALKSVNSMGFNLYLTSPVAQWVKNLPAM